MPLRFSLGVVMASPRAAVLSPPAGFVFILSPVSGQSLTSPVTGQPLIKAG